MQRETVSNPYIAPHLAELPLHRVLIHSTECLLLYCSQGPEDRGTYPFFLCRRPPASGRPRKRGG